MGGILRIALHTLLFSALLNFQIQVLMQFLDLEKRSHLPTEASPDISQIACCDRGYDRSSGRPRVSDPATYCSSTPRIQPSAVARWYTLLHGLPTAIREISGLETVILVPPFCPL
jgi:hypothetical protein